jgi:hypothetical protein
MEDVGLHHGDALKRCEELGNAIGGDVGESMEKIQKLIFSYYVDVRNQADRSFRAARRVAIAGFVVLCVAVAYVMVVDLATRLDPNYVHGSEVMTVGQLGLIAGAIVEILAGTQFWLHTRTSRQFGAFHICLERTHRYALAYKIAQTITTGKDATLEKIVCIMANAPMITREDMEGVTAGAPLRDNTSSLESTLQRASLGDRHS